MYDHKEYMKEYRKRPGYKEMKKRHAAKSYLKNRDSIRAKQAEYYQENKEKMNAANKEWCENNRERSNAIKKKWNKANPKLKNFYTQTYRARKRDQTPEDADMDAIKEIYLTCPDGWHVDHVHPLSKGGLHHQDNLQHLTAFDNLSKGNRL
tara:strand:+ start:57 stop:509 length:453 start_codon:yes stop_codon:yes gene_type:complete